MNSNSNSNNNENENENKSLFVEYYKQCQDNIRLNNSSAEKLQITLASGTITLLCYAISLSIKSYSSFILLGIFLCTLSLTITLYAYKYANKAIVEALEIAKEYYLEDKELRDNKLEIKRSNLEEISRNFLIAGILTSLIGLFITFTKCPCKQQDSHIAIINKNTTETDKESLINQRKLPNINKKAITEEKAIRELHQTDEAKAKQSHGAPIIIQKPKKKGTEKQEK